MIRHAETLCDRSPSLHAGPELKPVVETGNATQKDEAAKVTSFPDPSCAVQENGLAYIS